MSFISYGTPDVGPGSQKPDGDDTLWGTDDTELVSVGLSSDEQLREIRIDPSWKSKIDAENLSAAVLSAYMSAVVARVSTNPDGAPEVVPRSSQSSISNAGLEVPVIDYVLMEDVDREREDYLANYQDSLMSEQSFSSSDGNVTVVARGGSPISINFDSAWMGFADPSHIAASSTEALAPAIESGRAIAAQMRDKFPAIAEFRRLRDIRRAARGW
jgi:DNA-binding protein YbaB